MVWREMLRVQQLEEFLLTRLPHGEPVESEDIYEVMIAVDIDAHRILRDNTLYPFQIITITFYPFCW